MTTRVIGYFISSHGFGHAARAAAVMHAMQTTDPTIRFEIFTRVPRWFFEDSLAADFGYNSVLTDVGLVQETSLREDIAQTLQRLDEFYPFNPARVAQLAEEVKRLHCECIVCDIAPLGIAVAQAAGIPSILVENFTWDWIYAGYLDEEPRLDQHITYLRAVFGQASFHIQTEPVCEYRRANLVTRPVSRSIQTPASMIRERLSIPAQAQVVLITMGGIPEQHAFLDELAQTRDVYFVIPGVAETAETRGNVILLPHRSSFFHPDLLNACDAVVGKCGYSTLAEAYQAGIPFGYIPRARFRESDVMSAFIRKEMRGFEIPEAEFQDGRWLAALPDLLALPRITRSEPNGAIEIARFIAGLP